jgi:predicted transcriptional regulator
MRKLTEKQAVLLRRASRGDVLIPSMVKSLVKRGLIMQRDGKGYRRHEWGRDVGPTMHQFMLTPEGQEVLSSLKS